MRYPLPLPLEIPRFHRVAGILHVNSCSRGTYRYIRLNKGVRREFWRTEEGVGWSVGRETKASRTFHRSNHLGEDGVVSGRRLHGRQFSLILPAEVYAKARSSTKRVSHGCR